MKLRHLLGVLSLGLIVNMGVMNVHANNEVKGHAPNATTESKVDDDDPNLIKTHTAQRNASTKKTVVEAGWRNDGRWWYQNSNGSYPKAQWKLINNLWYYFDAQGYMLENTWVQGMYYVGSTGAMLTDTTTPDGYRVGPDGAWIDSNATSNKPKISSKYTRYTDKLRLYEVEGKLTMFLQGMDMSFVNANERSEFKVFDSYYTISNAYFLNFNTITKNYTKSVGPITLYVNKDAEVLLPDGNKTTASAYYEEHKNLSLEGDLFKASAIMVDENGYVKLLDIK